MININVLARVSDDKNSFIDIVYVVYKLKQQGVNNIQVTFIGAIQNYGIYNCVINMASLLEVSDKISFTKRSIPMNELSPEIKAGYFLHFCIGNFIGYSGIQSIKTGFKNIFYNAVTDVNLSDTQYPNVCADINDLVSFIKKISTEQTTTDTIINKADLNLLKDFSLQLNEKNILLAMLTPQIANT